MNIEKLASLIEAYIYVNFGLLAISFIGGVFWLIKKRFFRYAFNKHQIWNAQEQIETLEQENHRIFRRITAIEELLQRKDSKSVPIAKILQMIRVFHDGTCRTYNPPEMFDFKVTDLTPDMIGFRGVYTDEMLSEAISKLGFQGIEKIMVFENEKRELGTFAYCREIAL